MFSWCYLFQSREQLLTWKQQKRSFLRFICVHSLHVVKRMIECSVNNNSVSGVISVQAFLWTDCPSPLHSGQSPLCSWCQLRVPTCQVPGDEWHPADGVLLSADREADGMAAWLWHHPWGVGILTLGVLGLMKGLRPKWNRIRTLIPNRITTWRGKQKTPTALRKMPW